MFNKLAPFLQDYIYSQGWEELRPIQVGACDVIFNTDKNLILSSGTASGKTEAAFFPTLTDIYNNSEMDSIDILYVSPLKALINDQYERLSDILKETDIPVHKWHGDVSASKKAHVIKHPKGILQITPESLEALIMRKNEIMCKMFAHLKYVIIDEIHYFLCEDRGIQLRSLLERIQNDTENIPRRIVLSATLGDYSKVSDWVNLSTNREAEIVESENNRRIKLYVDYFPYDPEDDKNNKFYSKLFDITKNNKNIIFSNSRTDVEENVYRLNVLSKLHKTETEYYGHHSSISATVKNDIERKMKDEDIRSSVCSTTTLELGIDIGKLDQIVQVGSPYTVSSFLQRLGRSGRRNQLPQMAFMIKEREPGPDIYNQKLNMDLLLSIAIIELYRKHKWIESPLIPKKPFELLFHQLLSTLYVSQPISAKDLAHLLLRLSPFKDIKVQELKILLQFLLKNDFIELDENKEILLGKNGEYLTNNYNFFSVFETPVEYTVKTTEQVIGTVSERYKKGIVFLLQGKKWKVEELNDKTKTIYVSPANTEARNKWTSFGCLYIEDEIMIKAKNILDSDEDYPYLSNNAKIKLIEMRQFYKDVLSNTDNNYYFPWFSTKKFNSLCVVFDNLNIDYEVLEIQGIKMGFHFYEDVDILKCKEKFVLLNEKKINEEYLDFETKYKDQIPNELLEIKFLEDFFII